MAQQDLDRLLEQEVYPALFDRLDVAFPEFGWTRSGGAWKATIWPAWFPDPANEQRPDRLMVYPDRPWWVKVHGHAGVRFLTLANGGRSPEGAEFVDAVRDLCRRAGVAFPERGVTDEEARTLRAKEARRSALDVVLTFTHETLWSPTGASARDYLHGRGFTDENLRALGFGFYESANVIRDRLRRDHPDLVQAAEDAALLWQKLEGYVVIPWADAQGHPLTLYGRWAGKKVPTDGRPKTLALPGEGTKASPLYFDRARQAGHRDLVAVEGVFDAALLHARGESRVVAYVGAQFSGSQLETLTRYKVRSVIVQPDPDSGGDRGALSCVAGLVGRGIRAYVAPRLPDGLDPDEFLTREGLEAWKAHVSGAVSGPIYHARTLFQGVGPGSPDPVRQKAVEEVLTYVAGLRHETAALDKGDILVELSEQTGYAEADLSRMAEKRLLERAAEDEKQKLDRTLRDALAARERGEAPQDVIRQFQTALRQVEAGGTSPPPTFNVDRLVRVSQETRSGRLSGWDTLDKPEREGGLGLRFYPGELALLAARTGHGKTSVLTGLVHHWLRDTLGDELVVFYSLEEPEVRIFHRLVSLLTDESESRWSANEVRDYLQSPNSRAEWPLRSTLEAALNTLRTVEDRLLVVYGSGWSVAALDAHARRVASERSVAAVVCDYLQRLPGDGSFDRRDLEVSAVARRLKALAVDLNVPVVVGAQINREALRNNTIPQGSYSNEGVQKAIRSRRPRLEHLREGGSEQEADLVLGLLNYRADYEEDEDTKGTVPDVTDFEIGVLKNRYGAPGRWARLQFAGRYHVLRDA